MAASVENTNPISFMPYYEKSTEVRTLANSLLSEFATHTPLLDAKVAISYMLAFPCLDESGSPMEDAITKGGVKCLGLTRKNPTRQRKEGLADATITLDGPYWDGADEPERRSLLDHELEHVSVVEEGTSTEGQIIYKRDNAGRPVIRLRKHDIETGWFKSVAERHGAHAQERIQAKQILDTYGQYFWPDVISALNPKSRTSALEIGVRR